MAVSERQIRRLHELPGGLLAALLSPSGPAGRLGPDGVDVATFAAIDWEAVAAEANGHVVGVLVYERLAELGLADRLPSSVADAWRADSQHARLQHAIQRRDVLALSQAFTQAGVRHAFFKGFTYRDWFYRPAWARIGGDVDVLIDRHNVEPARSIARELRFTQAAFSPDFQHFRPATSYELAQVESRHYELGLFTKVHLLTNPPDWLLGPRFVRRSPFAFGRSEAGAVLNSSFDVHWAVHFMFADASPLDDARPSDVPGGTIPVLSPEWSVLISGFKLYFEAFDRPRYGFNHLVDLIGLLGLRPALDWSLLAGLVRRFALEAAMFYTLSAAERLAGRPLVPRELVLEWSEGLPSTTSHEATRSLDFGDFVPFLVGRRVASDFVAHVAAVAEANGHPAGRARTGSPAGGGQTGGGQTGGGQTGGGGPADTETKARHGTTRRKGSGATSGGKARRRSR